MEVRTWTGIVALIIEGKGKLGTWIRPSFWPHYRILKHLSLCLIVHYNPRPKLIDFQYKRSIQAILLATASRAKQKPIKASHRKGVVIAIKDPSIGKEGSWYCKALGDLVNRIDNGECLTTELKHPIIAIGSASQPI